MKYFSICLIFIALCSCKKDEIISSEIEKSRTELLIGEWILFEYNDHDFLDFEFRYAFKNNYDLHFSFRTNPPTPLSRVGTWQWAAEESKLVMNMDSIEISFDVLKLTEQELWLNSSINEKWKLVKQ